VRLSALANRSRGDVFVFLRAVPAIPDAPYTLLSSLVYFLKLYLIENRENRGISGIFCASSGPLIAP
jgi:hypothetical protein